MFGGMIYGSNFEFLIDSFFLLLFFGVRTARARVSFDSISNLDLLQVSARLMTEDKIYHVVDSVVST